jgi:pimeloyl-ACP methyl ester carboxylesterase
MNKVMKGYNLSIHLESFQLSYDDIGEGNMPIIFLHGYPFVKGMWHEQLEGLKSSFRVIACDIRGFGKSKDETTALCIDLFAEDLIDFMDKLEIEKAIVCGLSMGGFIALNAIKRFPNRIEAMILCDTQCIADTPEVKENRYKVIEDIGIHGAESFCEGFVKSVFHEDSFMHKKELVEQLRKVVFSNSVHIIGMGLKALAERGETCSALAAISVPTLIICGREDEVTPLLQSELMHQGIKGSMLKIIEKSGHVSNLEHPIEFNQFLLAFLTTLSSVHFKNLGREHL